MVSAAAEEGLIATGVELNYGLVLYSRLDSLRKGFWKRTNFIRRDLFKTNLSNYDVIVLFGVPSMMDLVKQKLLVEMRPDAMFVACRFPLPNVKPSAQLGSGIDTVWVYSRSDIQKSLSKA
ncbi:hypothetical protein RvY_08097-2 [Ramazzottius varieornatus]|uniref:Uncharacterized protein n=1 Tax=Ramazzottius varieornatus TaxID=947166 RepID=A0A1D1V4K4_RAMVA|nr:hypothetical protein RvY_08097-2 [Ramazzottius varieornatus]